MTPDEILESKLKDADREIKKILGKYGFALTAIPFIENDGRVMARPVLAVLRDDKKEVPDSVDSGTPSDIAKAD